MAADTLALIKAGLDIAKGTKDFLSSHKESGKKDHKLYDALCRALRFIYFPDSGVLGLLKDIAAMKPISDERAEKVLTDFNDYEWKARDILMSLSFDRLEEELGLTLATIRVLADIRDGKASLRQAVQDEVNSYGQKNFRPNKKRIESLISAIEMLNSSIEQIEAVINQRAPRG
jgi:hypothetical protein